MRIGIVRGSVVLNVSTGLAGVRLAIVEPVTAGNLAARNAKGGGKSVVAVDQLGAAEGQMVGFVEGREAANPWWPGEAPVDAYCALLVENAEFQSARERIRTCDKTILIPSAQDLIGARGLTLRRAAKASTSSGSCGWAGAGCQNCPGAKGGGAAVGTPSAPTVGNDELVRLFTSPEAEAVKNEIIAVGRKLWQRMYVDGNGGNISSASAPTP